MATIDLPVRTFGTLQRAGRDYEHGDRGEGVGTITGNVKTQTTPTVQVPTYCKVRLERDQDGFVVRETFTDPITGVYTFTGINKAIPYTVIAIHPILAYRNVLANGLYPT